mmetsp:Transcript_106377/g.216977  ORF Transcript_106377/g.216977 Transcript_106377/m.216977 type:complete len:590 (-) Transcript_106377:490-2259(-)
MTTKTTTKTTTKSFVLLAVFLTTLLLSMATKVSAAKKCEGKKLVVLAGPRRSAVSSVADFLYQYARGVQSHHASGKLYHPLRYFRWPMVYGKASNNTEAEMPYKRFNHLITEPDNKALRDEIMYSIKRDWELPECGTVILGGEEFDQVGDLAVKGFYDPVQAVRDIMEHVGSSPECVTIVLNYRVPRFEHWVSLYSSKSLLSTDSEDGFSFKPYEEHMCMETSKDSRLNELGTTMNPMYIAEQYLEAEDFNVRMIDMGGVDDANTDISHTIACKILPGKCEDGQLWVKGHHEEVFTNKMLKHDFSGLPAEEIVMAEKLFRYRDCAYQDDLTQKYDGRFSTVLPKSIWEDCNQEEKGEIYKSFRRPVAGTKKVFDALLSQVDCGAFGGVHVDEELDQAGIVDYLNGAVEDEDDDFSTLPEIPETVKKMGPVVLAALSFVFCFACVLFKRRNYAGYSSANIEMRGLDGGGGRSKNRHNYEFNKKKKKSRSSSRRRYEESDDDSSSSSDDSDYDLPGQRGNKDSFRDERGGSSNKNNNKGGGVGGFLSRFGKKDKKVNYNDRFSSRVIPNDPYADSESDSSGSGSDDDSDCI